MYLRQKCPQCGIEKEYVYVQVGHHAHCKNCNTEFRLEPKRFVLMPYFICGGVLLVAAVVLFYILRTFHDWWIYR